MTNKCIQTEVVTKFQDKGKAWESNHS